MIQPKYVQVAESIRAQIANGALAPGAPAPSGAALARATGYSTLTCRRALQNLVKQGVLVPGASRSARPLVPRPASADEQTRTDAARALSGTLAGCRHAVGLTQPQLAEKTGVSITTIGHAETGRLWQSRRFWEAADEAVNAGGKLLRLHDAYRAAAVRSNPATSTPEPLTTLAPAKTTVAATVLVACVTITWANGEVTTVYPPT
jgi:DNA-binding transcriptional regulator YhcF (GntR family)